MSVETALSTLTNAVPDPSAGLPDEIFYYISSMTPLVNVDLLIKDDNERVLLSWRDDQYAGRGWHIPGGIVRFKETLESRIEKVAMNEVGRTVNYDPIPVEINQMIHRTRDIRGHFLSFLYRCHLPASFIPLNTGLMAEDNGYLAWHDRCPRNLLPVHEVYRRHIDRLVSEQKTILADDVVIATVFTPERGS